MITFYLVGVLTSLIVIIWAIIEDIKKTTKSGYNYVFDTDDFMSLLLGLAASWITLLFAIYSKLNNSNSIKTKTIFTIRTRIKKK